MAQNKPEEAGCTTGRWSAEEQAAFEAAYEVYGRDWKQIAREVQTRSVVQVRSHAQKYFKKLSRQAFKAPSQPSTSELYQLWAYHQSMANECLMQMKALELVAQPMLWLK